MDGFNLEAWARRGKRKSRTVVLRPLGPSRALYASLLSMQLHVLRIAARKLRDDVLPLAKAGRAELQRDSVYGFGFAFDVFREFVRGYTYGFKAGIGEALRKEDERHARKFHAAMRAAMGVDLVGAIQREGIGSEIETATQRAASLIRGVTDDLTKRIEQTLIKAMSTGMSNRDIAAKLSEDFGFARRRAEFIARDQAASFNGNLNRIRAREAGVTEYDWSTSRDERVRGNPDGKYPTARPSHWEREGKRFRWNDPPEGGHPGEAINCRCVALHVITF